MGISRRQVLKTGALGLVAGSGYLGYRFVPPAAIANPRPPGEVAQALVNTMSGEQLERFTVPYDHPFRQYHNRGVWAGGELVSLGGFDRGQLSLISELMRSGLSESGRSVVTEQYFMSLPDIMINNLLICGDPGTEDCQMMITGPHLNLRIGGVNREGVAFGGPQVYGDQRGDEEAGLPGNQYLPTLRAGMALFNALPATMQADALIEVSPVQTQIEVRGSDFDPVGVPVGEMSTIIRQQVRDLITLILSPYPEADVTYAWQCIESNGGIESMHLSYYLDSTYDNGVYQNFRLESPAAVFYFRGFPHVHAFFNVAMNGDEPLSVGEEVGYNPSVIEGEAMQALLEASMLATGNVDFAYYNIGSVVGRLRAGSIRTGDLYNAESWNSQIRLVETKGRDLGGILAERMQAAGETLVPERVYRIATTDYVAGQLVEVSFGDGNDAGSSGMLRDALIRYVREQGFQLDSRLA